MSDEVKVQGTVRWFNVQKGYGFILQDTQKEKDVFVHYSNIAATGYKSLKEGDRVEFILTTSDKGLCATDVSVIKEA